MDWGLMQTIATVIFGIVAVISLVVAFRLARKKKPVWAYTTTKIIGLGTDAPAELKLVFNDKQILEVYRTELIFFNMGNASIRKDDVSDPVTVHFEGAEFLRDPYAMQINRHENRINIVVDRNNSLFGIDFLFLDRGDGVIVEVMHDKSAEVECKGNIIDAGKPCCIGKFERQLPEGYKLNIVVSLVFISFISWMWFSYISSVVSGSDSQIVPALAGIMTIATVLIVGQGAYRLYKSLRFPSWSRTDYRKNSIM